MASIQIYAATVYVSDQEKALDFYVNSLGFEKRQDSPFGSGGRWLVVVPPGAETGIALLRPADAQEQETKIGGFTGIDMVTSDIQGLYAELSGRGVQFQGPPQQMPWGEYAAWFSDPDGNGFFINQMG